MKRIIFTGGGTAGHVTPNIALIERLEVEGWEIHYIGTREGMEHELLKKLPQVTYHTISSGKLRRYFSWQNFIDPFRVIKGVFQSRRIVREVAPDVIFSKGGFVSVPVVIGAGRVPVVSHESDYTPGLANRIAAVFSDTVCVSFEDTLAFVKGGKGVYTGTPIRSELYRGDAARAKAMTGFAGIKPVLLVMGGSLGAKKLNDLLHAALDELLTRFDIVHLCGRGKECPELNQPGYVQYEYVHEELPDLFALCDIVLSRAGANAVFELLALNKPALLVPLTLSSTRGDQLHNAKYFEKKGYALWIDQDTATKETLIAALDEVYRRREELIKTMEKDLRSDGTDEVLDVIKRAAGADA